MIELLNYLSRVTEQKRYPFFVNVGANDGITGDPCGEFFLRHFSWTGLLIEPVPYCVERLKSIYHEQRFSVVQSAVGIRGLKQFYYVFESAKELPDLPPWFDQLGSFDVQHILKHLAGRLKPYITSREIFVETLREVLEVRRIEKVDFLQIDTEGSDLIVLKSLDGFLKPKAILIEHVHLSESNRAELLGLLTPDYDVVDLSRDFFAELKHDG